MIKNRATTMKNDEQEEKKQWKFWKREKKDNEKWWKREEKTMKTNEQ